MADACEMTHIYIPIAWLDILTTCSDYFKGLDRFNKAKDTMDKDTSYSMKKMYKITLPPILSIDQSHDVFRLVAGPDGKVVEPGPRRIHTEIY